MITGEDVLADRTRRKLSRTKYAALVGLTSTKVHNIEHGRALKPEEISILTPFVSGGGDQDQLTAGLPTLEQQPQADPPPPVRDISAGLYITESGVTFEVINANGWHSRCPVCNFQFTRTSGPAVMDWMVQHITTCTGDPDMSATDELLNTAIEQRSAEEISAPADAPSDTFAPVDNAPPGLDLVDLADDDEPDDDSFAVIETFADVVQFDSLVPPQVLRPDTSTGRLFSNGEIQSFKRCRRRWWLGWYRALRLKAESAIGPRSIGTRVHGALEAWYAPEGTPRTDPREALERIIVEDWTNLVKSFDPYPPDDETVRKFQSECDLTRAMIEGYVEWLAETGADSDLTVIASETYLEATLPIEHEVPVKIIGKLDVRMRRRHDDAKLLMDHKTVGNLTDPMKMIAMNEQMLQYHLLELLTGGEGERSDGALYNMLRKVKRTARATPPFYERVEVRHNAHEIDAFMRRLSGEIMDILAVQAALDNGGDPQTIVYPTINDTCSWQCDFYPVCPMFDDGSRVEDAIEQYYTTGNPLAHYAKEVETT